MPAFNEDSLSEQPAIEQLKRMGYVYVHGDKLDPQENEKCERSSRREAVLVARLKKKLAELNPEATEQTIEKAVRRVTNIQGTGLLDENRQFHKDLISNITIEQDGRGLTIKFIDFEKPERNEFLVVNQFSIKGPNPPDRRPDLIIFVNGIPLVVIECKSPVAKGTGVNRAIGDLLVYQEEIPSLFRTNQILMGVNLFGARYGTVGSVAEHYHEWKEGGEELRPEPAAQDLLIASILNKRNLLDIIRHFIVFEKKEGRLIKKICRYQQFVAVQKIVQRVLEGKDRKGIVWHWQGSGKSLTMLFAALKLRWEEKRLKRPFIVIVTDRTELDGQITKTFQNCGFPDPVHANNARELYSLLRGEAGQTIMTTIQKFRMALEEPLSKADNIIVLVDEAHRTQYGNFAFNLKKALPNAARFAFTGTPLNKQDRSTYREFSPEGEIYIDRYSIKQSEEDKATVPIKYTSRLAELQVVGASVDSLLKHLFPEADKKELARIKKQYATADILAEAPRRIERIALDIAEHYNTHIKPNGLKAMVVAPTRAAADSYKKALDKLINPESSTVVMTLDEKKDPKEWRDKYRLTREEEDELKERFNEPKDPLSLFIVCDKLLTGFDAPILQAMYLDQSVKEHTLLQAVARTNRNYPRKNYGLVVDYCGVGKELAKALAMFSKEDLDGLFRINDVEIELGKLSALHKAAMVFFKAVNLKGREPKAMLQECVFALKETQVRMQFEEAFRAFAKSMDFLMPDLRVEPYLKDFKLLGLVREGARNLYRDERLAMEYVSAKIEGLIHAHIAAEGVSELLQPVTITTPDFAYQVEGKISDKGKAIYTEEALREVIRLHVREDPAFYGTLKDELEKVIDDQKRSRLDDAQAFKQMMRIKEEAAHRENQAKKLGLEESEFAFFGLFGKLKDKTNVDGQADQITLAKEAAKIIQERRVTEWQEREDIQKEMRREIKRLLRRKGCSEEDLGEIVREVMELALGVYS